MCGNPRRWYGQKSYHERQADEAMRQQMDELEAEHADPVMNRVELLTRLVGDSPEEIAEWKRQTMEPR